MNIQVSLSVRFKVNSFDCSTPIAFLFRDWKTQIKFQPLYSQGIADLCNS